MMSERPTRQELEARVRELEQVLSECMTGSEARYQVDRGYRKLLSRLPIGVYRNTPGRNGRFIMANETIAKMFGYESRIEFMQTNVSDLYMDPSERCEFSYRLLSNDRVENEVLRLKKKDGSMFWGSVTAIAVRNDEGTVDYFDGIIQDITEQHKIIEEKEIARRLLQSVLDAEKKLRESESRFRAILDHVENIPVQGYDENRNAIYWNTASEKVYGYSKDEALGRKIENLIIPEKMRPEVIKGIDRWVIEGVPIPAGELVLWDKEKKPVHVYSSHVMHERLSGAKEMLN